MERRRFSGMLERLEFKANQPRPEAAAFGVASFGSIFSAHHHGPEGRHPKDVIYAKLQKWFRFTLNLNRLPMPNRELNIPPSLKSRPNRELNPSSLKSRPMLDLPRTIQNHELNIQNALNIDIDFYHDLMKNKNNLPS